MQESRSTFIVLIAVILLLIFLQTWVVVGDAVSVPPRNGFPVVKCDRLLSPAASHLLCC